MKNIAKCAHYNGRRRHRSKVGGKKGCTSLYVYRYLCGCNVYRVMLLRDRECVLEEEGDWFLGESVCVCLCGVGGVCVCTEGVETDSRIPFALVSVGLDQV